MRVGRTGRLFGILLGLFVLIQSGVFWLLDGTIILLFSSLLIGSTVVLLVIKNTYSFLFIAIISLGLAFGLTVMAFSVESNQVDQFLFITLHIGFTLSLTIIWFLLNKVEGFVQSLNSMRIQVEDLIWSPITWTKLKKQ